MVAGKIKIDYSWERSDGKTKIDKTHKDKLHEDAIARAFEQINQGYVCGELCSICTSESDNGKNIETEYRGWWEMKINRK